MNLNVDKSQWTKVRLGDVATEYSRRINDPSSGDRERFVGSSCIGQWDFRVQEWESTASVTSAMKLFEEGDYLLVRRSLYASDFRERAPRAHFAGVCSGDILTIRENPEFIADGFLIGILNNPSIWSYIVANASGSITRRIKWKDLANYEFLLPPKDQQAEIAELLWASDAQVDGTTSMVLSCEQLIIADRESRFLGLNEEKTVQHSRLKGDVGASLTFVELGDLALDVSYGTSVKSNTVKSGIPVLGIPQVLGGKLELADLTFVELGSKEHEKLMLRKGDILIIRTNGNPSFTGKSSIFDEGGDFVFASYLIRVRVDPEVVLPRFLIAYLQTTIVRRYFTRSATSSAGNYNINSQTIKRLPVPILSLVDQENLVRDVESDQDCLEMLVRRLELGNELQRSLVNSFFDHV